MVSVSHRQDRWVAGGNSPSKLLAADGGGLGLLKPVCPGADSHAGASPLSGCRPRMHGSQPLRCCDTGPLCLHLVARGSQRLTPDTRWPGRAILHCGQPSTRQAALPATTPLRRAQGPQDGQDRAARGPEPYSEVTPVLQSCLDKRHRILTMSRDNRACHLSAVPSGVHAGIIWEGLVQWQERPWSPQMPQSPQQSCWIPRAARLGQRRGRSTEQGRSLSPADVPARRDHC